jgi:hypothetical protein
MGNCLSISRRHEPTKKNSHSGTESGAYIPTTKLIAGGNDVTLSTSTTPAIEAKEIESFKTPPEKPRLETTGSQLELPIEPSAARGSGGFGGCECAAGGGGAEGGAGEREAGRGTDDWAIGGGGCA